MRPIATDTADFPSLRRDRKVYVDKTAYMYRLVTDANSRLFFISRPRRFGKSLTISALKTLFQGRREFFDGLAIDRMGWEWEKYPIVHFELNDVSTASIDEFKEALNVHVRERLEEAGYPYDIALAAPENFGKAIKFLSARNGGKGVVILIDEYDAPVGHALDNVEKAEAVRSRLSDLYSQMKNRAGDIRFMLMTGVSKFTKLSVFSTLNNIVDISQDDEYATMFGYTEDELSENFDEHLRAHADKMGKSYEDYRQELKRWYNGFRFARFVEDTVYNPISIAITLSKMQPTFSATWATTGRPSMLMNYLKREDMLKISPEGTQRVRDSALEMADLGDLQPIPMLFQSGYLTIRDYRFGLYALGVPDEEVRQDLCLLMTGVAADKNVFWASRLGDSLLCAEWDDFFEGLKSLYAGMAYGTTEKRVHENSYGRCLSFLLASCGFDFSMEAVQSNGRADVVAKHPALVCIFELKVDEPIDNAFSQIKKKGYADPFRADRRPVWLVGLSFDSKTRRLVECAVENARQDSKCI